MGRVYKPDRHFELVVILETPELRTHRHAQRRVEALERTSPMRCVSGAVKPQRMRTEPESVTEKAEPTLMKSTQEVCCSRDGDKRACDTGVGVPLSVLCGGRGGPPAERSVQRQLITRVRRRVEQDATAQRSSSGRIHHSPSCCTPTLSGRFDSTSPPLLCWQLRHKQR